MDDFNRKLNELIEENRVSAELNQAKQKERFYGFLGFTIFDIIHILVGLFFFVTLLIQSPGAHLEVAESVMEVVLSFTLIVFIHGLADTSVKGRSFVKSYSFAWLMAAASLLTPSLFKIVEWDFNDLFAYILDFALLAVNGVLYLSFFISVIAKQKKFVWRVLILIGIVCGYLSSLLSLVYCFTSEYMWDTMGIISFVLTIVKHLAPAILSTMATLGYTKVFKEIKKVEER